MSKDHKREDGARTKAATAGVIKDTDVKIGGEWKFAKNAPFLKARLDIWDELYAKQDQVYKDMPHQPIKIIMPDGAVKEGVSFETSPYDIAAKISKQMADKIVVAKVKFTKRVATLDEGLLNPEAEEGKDEDDQWYFWDVTRALEGDCELFLFKFDDKEGKETFWHSSAHILGETLENEFGVHLCHGPPTDSGFFYDSYTGKKDIFTEKHYKDIDKAAQKIVSEKQTFSRLILTKEEALRLFGLNPFKVQLISNKIPDGGKVTAYRCGQLIDLCTGPHIPTTKMIKAFRVLKNSSAYWLGKAGNDSLQRIYGVTFPSKKEMDEHIHLLEEAAKRDHRTIGRDQGLFDMNPMSPGCGFMYPKGTIIYNKLMDMIRTQYRVRGYTEVLSPNLFNLKLWKTSGHYANYKDDMFILKVENQGFGMKPMNCPAHCLMFANQQRTYRELPIRYADFGVLHRNEISGALSGLTRVRRFCQDDAHHFCEPHQITDEIGGVLDFLDHIYGIFGFKFELELSTRPENRLGDDALWDEAEGALTKALNDFGRPWKIDAGGGAFYGPKIDIKVYDALKRPHQCGTVQLDFQLPIRFNLQFKTDAKYEEKVEGDGDKCEKKKADKKGKKDKKGENGEEKKDEEPKEEEAKGDKVVLKSQMFKKDEWDTEDFEWKEQVVKPGFSRPVMIHRAILGSVERFMAILIEHLGGKWPFFLSPRQAVILPISVQNEKLVDYCNAVYLYLHQKGYNVETDFGKEQLPKKVRKHQLEQWNFILVAGEDEMNSGTIDIRTRDNERAGKMRIDELHDYFQSILPAKSNMYEKFYEKAWNPKDFSVSTCRGDDHKADAPSSAKASKDKSKLFVKDPLSSVTQMIQVTADIAGAPLEVEVTTDSKKSLIGRLPFLETSDGTVLFDTGAIIQHLARQNPGCGLLGSSAFDQAKVNQWIAWTHEHWFPGMHKACVPLLGMGSQDPKRFAEGLKQSKEAAKTLDTYLKGKDWLVGSKMSAADIFVGGCLVLAFQTIFDAGFRKAMPNLSSWFERFSQSKDVQKRFGIIKPCAKAMKVQEAGKGPKQAPAKKEEQEKKKADDDMDDLFGSDEDDGAAAKAAAAAAKAKAQGAKKKKAVIAMSLVMLDVKPVDDTTDLDALAPKIFKEITQDGLFWKTEYKKVPVAFGIFKLIVGFSCEDEKTSVDDIVEKIEAMEDFVQSVEITAFNKI